MDFYGTADEITPEWLATLRSPKEHLSNCANNQNEKRHETKNKKKKG